MSGEKASARFASSAHVHQLAGASTSHHAIFPTYISSHSQASMSFPICDNCTSGHVLPGEPTGSMEYGGTAYYAPAPAPAPATESSVGETQTQDQDQSAQSKKKFAIVLLTDIYGLPLGNCKLIADRFAKELGCDVWVPDLFKGMSPLCFCFPSNVC